MQATDTAPREIGSSETVKTGNMTSTFQQNPIPKEIRLDNTRQAATLTIDTFQQAHNSLTTENHTPLSFIDSGDRSIASHSSFFLFESPRHATEAPQRWDALQCPPAPEHADMFGKFWQELEYGPPEQYEPLNHHAMVQGASIHNDYSLEVAPPFLFTTSSSFGRATMISPPRKNNDYFTTPSLPPLAPRARGIVTRKRAPAVPNLHSPVTPPRKKNRTCKGRTLHAVSRVGVDSLQMMSIHRMVAYLRETDGNAALLEAFDGIVQTCISKHEERESPKYDNLPGAIFDDAVEELGGDVFACIFKDSLAFHPQRCQAAAIAADQNLKDKVFLERSDPRLPNLLEVGLAYGFHLARLTLLEHGGSFDDVQQMLDHGAATVLGMKEEERIVLHRYVVGSQMLRTSKDDK